jgi:hypothetical protein
MRTPRNDRPLDPTSPKGSRRTEEPERRCILTGESEGRDTLLRLALSPDGILVPDVLAKAPGRGAWIGVDRATLENAIAKGKIKGALARAFKGAKVTLVDDLPEAIERAFRQQFLAQLGLAARAGALLSGAEKVDVAARSGAVSLLAHAADAADDGRRKRDQSWRVGSDAEGTGLAGRILPVDRSTLSVALGRDNVVHIALTDAQWALRLAKLLDRWQRYAVSATGAAERAALPDDTLGSASATGDGIAAV